MLRPIRGEFDGRGQLAKSIGARATQSQLDGKNCFGFRMDSIVVARFGEGDGDHARASGRPTPERGDSGSQVRPERCL